MGKSSGIRIFLRVRPPATAQHSSLLGDANPAANQPCDYEVEHDFNGSTIRLHNDRKGEADVVNNTAEVASFAFRRVFDTSTSQEEVFNAVAKDCVQSVMDGYNSTVFAYGQTGSGKTFSITGGTDSYDDRGMIPRALAMVYDETRRRDGAHWMVKLSYLQIYNDKGQDLLCGGKDAKSLEDLPQVTVHEGTEDITLKGLEQYLSPTLNDALHLLFIGDTNRLYCETPMNKTSSRSHCIFTISLEARTIGSSVVRRSKLNFVDLAGSERVSKTGVAGNTLTEAKYINLSLHYLEHVIVALSEQANGKRQHVPFRNSFMTMVLRDSLGGNCRTSMLATAHLAKGQLPETLSTCQFAQRVALIRQNAHVNEETDPVLLVRKLKAEVAQLKDQLAFYEGEGKGANRELTDDEQMMCRSMVTTYVENPSPSARIEGFEGDLARIFYAFDIMKEMLKSRPEQPVRQMTDEQAKELETFREQVDALQVSLLQKENEMNTLLQVVQQSHGAHYNAETQLAPYGDQPPLLFADELLKLDARNLVANLRAAAAVAGLAPSRTPQRQQSHPEAMWQPSSSPSNGSVAGPAAQVQCQEQQQQAAAVAGAAMQRVAGLNAAGKLSEAEATAAQEYLQGKQQHLRDAYNLTALTDQEILNDRPAAFETFKRSCNNYAKLEKTKADLRQRCEECKNLVPDLNGSSEAIKRIKMTIQQLRAQRAVAGVEEPDAEEQSELNRLDVEKEKYRQLAQTLRGKKEDVEGMKAFMVRAQDQMLRDFKDWLTIRQKQVNMVANSSNPSSGAPNVLNPTPPRAGSLEMPPNHLRASLGGVASAPDISYALNGGTAFPPSSAPTATPSAPSSSPACLRGGDTRLDSSSHQSTEPRSLAGPVNNSWVNSPTGLKPLQAPVALNPSTSENYSSPLGMTKRSTNAFHLQPLGDSAPTLPLSSRQLPQVDAGPSTTTGIIPQAPLVPSSSAGIPSPGSNPYAPSHRSTGNAAADEQLAALYRARESLRQQWQPS